MSFYSWKPYVSVAERQRRAQRRLAKLAKKGQVISPVKVEGRLITQTFWGDAWYHNLEAYSDFHNRLPRGRTYVRNGSVLDLQIAPGLITAMVSGSEIYRIEVQIKPVTKAHWKAICQECSGSIDSLVELLQGKLSHSVMDRVCRQGSGLFPSPQEIKLACSCPDWAGLCKHVAAVLYGVGVRLDSQPELLFLLRKVDVSELIDTAGQDLELGQGAQSIDSLVQEDLGALFDLELGGSLTEPPSRKPSRTRSRKTPPKPTRTPRKKATSRMSATRTQPSRTQPVAKKKIKTTAKRLTKKTAKTVQAGKTKRTSNAKKKAAPVRRAKTTQ